MSTIDTTSPRRLWIDTDPGADDVQAILLACQGSPAVRLVGLSASNGNVPAETTTRNALGALALAGRADVPVFTGAQKPLSRDAHYDFYFGEDGLGGFALPPALADRQPGDAVEALLAESRLGPDRLILACIGPMTLLAQALSRDPDLADRIEVVAMGGAFLDAGFNGCGRKGNVTERAEFNIHVDPEAAAQVFATVPRITLVPWELALAQAVTPDLLAQLRALTSPAGKAMAAMLGPSDARALEEIRALGLPGACFCDPLVSAYVLDPGAFRGIRGRVTVGLGGATGDGPDRGETVLHPNDGAQANVLLLTEADRGRVHALFADAIASYEALAPTG